MAGGFTGVGWVWVTIQTSEEAMGVSANIGALYPLSRPADESLTYLTSGRRLNAAISSVLRTSRMPSANAGTFQVSPSMAGTRATS